MKQEKKGKIQTRVVLYFIKKRSLGTLTHLSNQLYTRIYLKQCRYNNEYFYHDKAIHLPK